MKKFAHIVNLSIFPETSELHSAQPVTIKTMEIARDFASGTVEVALLSAQYSEEYEIVPENFMKTRDLDRSVLDVGTFQVPRKLPIIKDILDRAYETVEADYIIYSNVDIGLLPSFYVSIDKLIDLGFDSLVVNRRTISKSRTRVEDIPLMYAEVGRPHMGYDCFVFKREAYKKFFLDLTCIGTGFVGKTLLINQILTSNNFKVFGDQHITFHLGNDKLWIAGYCKRLQSP